MCEDSNFRLTASVQTRLISNQLFVTLCFCRDEEMDGEWEAPQISNPKCETAPGCGQWVRPMKNNPNYKGKWKAPMIDNPNYQVITIL